MDAHTCPRCELRFASTIELEDHLRTDHDVELHRKTRADVGSRDPAPEEGDEGA